MNAIERKEFHRFEAEGSRFVYLVPSAAVFRVDDASSAVLEALESGPQSPDALTADLAPRFTPADVARAVRDLLEIRAVGPAGVPPEPVPVELPPENFPLTTMVLNVTSQCNLSCTYCYEYGEDKIVDTAGGGMPRYMDEETARKSVDWMFTQSGTNEVVHLTFFGGETLLNFRLLKTTLAYARRRGVEEGKRVEASLTTNGTLLKPDVIEWLAENEVGVTISIDGPKEVQDKFRIFNNGMGSYDVMLPKVTELLKRHTSRPIGARVTLTGGNLDVIRIFRHLTEEIGFWEVGFAPVTTSSCRGHAISEEGYDRMLSQFKELSADWLEAAVENRHHGFSNVRDTVEELHKGVSKAYPCGAGLGLMGVSTDGNVGLCHRFAGSEEHRIGSVSEGVDREKQQGFLEKHHISHKTDCRTCWARPLCAGGCYHEAHTRYGTTAVPNLHYCDWIRDWTDTCLKVYGALAERNPSFLARFEN